MQQTYFTPNIARIPHILQFIQSFNFYFGPDHQHALLRWRVDEARTRARKGMQHKIVHVFVNIRETGEKLGFTKRELGLITKTKSLKFIVWIQIQF